MLEQRVLFTQSGGLQPRRPTLDPTIRRMIFGPIRPMERPGFFRRLFGG